MIDRNQALELIQNALPINVVKHSLAVEATMKALSKRFNGDESLWGLVGILHDLDWEQTKLTPELHALKTVELLKQKGETRQELLSAISAHNYSYNKTPEPSTPMEWSLATCDSLTGLITATALILPDKKLASVTKESVMKKFGSKNFAARTNREMIKLCETKLNIPLPEYIDTVLKAMQSIAPELGL